MQARWQQPYRLFPQATSKSRGIHGSGEGYAQRRGFFREKETGAEDRAFNLVGINFPTVWLAQGWTIGPILTSAWSVNFRV